MNGIQTCYANPYCDYNVNTKNKNSFPFWVYPVMGAVTGAGAGGVMLLQQNKNINSALKILKQDTFDASKDIKHILTDNVNKENIYEVTGAKNTLFTLKQGIDATKETLINSANGFKENLKNSAPKYLAKCAGIGVAAGIVMALCDKLSDNNN